MSNVLPPEGVRTARREYRLRVAAVWGFLIATAIGVSAGLLLPTFILVSVEFESVGPLLDAEEAVDTEAYRANVDAVERANTLAAHLSRAERGMTAASALAEVRRDVPSGITLTGIAFAKEGEREITLQARGVAATRESLIAFVAALRRNPNFADAAVPVGNLAEGANAPFTATITVRTQRP